MRGRLQVAAKDGSMVGRVAMIAVLTLAPLSVQAQAVDRFNLRCKIEAAWWEFDGERKPMPLQPDSLHEPFTLQLDLAGKSWCDSFHCNDVSALSYDANEIRLERKRRGIFTPKDFVIRRRTGEFRSTDLVRDANGPLSIEIGSCRPSAFTPFPKAKF